MPDLNDPATRRDRTARPNLPGIWICTIRWLRTRHDPLRTGQFTYHCKGRGLVIGVTVFITVESLITHVLLLAIFGPAWWTWLLLAFGLYSAAWIFGRYCACMAVLPHFVGPETVRLYCGNIAELTIPRQAVLRARLSARSLDGGRGKLVLDEPDAEGCRDASFSNGSCNIAIDLDPGADLVFNGELVTDPIATLHINVDEPADFIAALARADL
jgi:hypothetical protein